MRRRYRYDPDLECLVEIGGNYFEERPQGPNVITDDIGAGVNGLRHMASGRRFDSKSGFRAETRARGLQEVGNETNFASRHPAPLLQEYGREVKTASEQIAGNWNGTADWLAAQRRK